MTPAGDYWGVVKSAVVTKSEKSKADQLAVTINVTHGADGAEVSAPIERTVYWSFTPNAWDYTQKKLETLGFNGDFESPVFNDAATNLGVWWRCDHEVYNGKAREKWDLRDWGGAREIVPADKDTIRTLAARWKAKAGAPKSRPPAADIPF